MDKRILILFTFCFSFLFAEQDSTNALLQGIYITSQRDDVLHDGRPEVKGIEFSNLEVPGDAENLKQLLEPYLGMTLTKKNAIEIKQKILTYYLTQKKPLTTVSLPEQQTTGNVIQVLVSEQRFGRPIYKGETWYSNEQLNKYLSIEPGRSISEDTLQNNMSWLNRNPFHYTNAKYVPSNEPGVVDLEVTTKKRRELRFYTRGSNTGTATTGFGRFATGFAWGNALWRGDLFSFEYAFSDQFSRYQSYTGSYTSFFPWKHMALFYINYATVSPIDPKVSSTARSLQGYIHYMIPIKPLYTRFKQEVNAGIEYKNIDSNYVNLSSGVVQVQLPSSGPIIQKLNVSQLYANYTLYDELGKNKIAFSVNIYGSPAAFLPYQTNADFNILRPNSKNQYFYSRFTFSEIYTEPNIMSIAFLLRGQVSNSTLPPTELFSLGGYNTVRGYHEAEFSADNCLITNLELRTKPMKLSTKLKDRLILLAFIDYAVGNNWFTKSRAPQKTPPDTQHLFGVGPGLRYAINPYLQARADYGFKLDTLFIGNKPEETLRLGFGQFHLGLLVSY